ncbi:putative neural-cadherin 2 [Palaemon carinicauda]|uniref:putative neural-cadherin 2 n=1 Tax=Palaemon carinicauda TaxID=392227 RepID=UPI0035B598C5
MRSAGRVGQLYARRRLDYENPSHRREFAFKLQVTDRGEEGWQNPAHVDTAWLIVQIQDVNDNAPVFDTTHAQISVKEDAPRGTALATFHARDPDGDGNGVIDYKIIDQTNALEIDAEGVVRTKSDSFDREALEEDTPIIRITGVDRGEPPLTSTATLSLTVMDINDCAPYILPPTVFHILEGVPPTKLGLLKAYDDDSWALGNGPPFNISLAPTNPQYIYEFLEMKFDRKLDSGRGAATLWTRKPIDREKHHQLDIRVKLTDARGLSNAQTVTVVVDDVNDNPMKPGRKTIYLYKIQGSGGSVNVPLGRVFVEDPDDWDLKDKTFEWATSGHPLFTLDQQDGTIYASSQVREGR